MSKQLHLGLMSMLSAFLMVAAIFAAIATPVSADVQGQAGFSVDKQTWPDPTQTYNVGDPINYTIRTRNPGNFSCVVDIWDVLPDGDIKYLDNDSYYGPGEIKWFNFSATVEADWVGPDCRIKNRVFVQGNDSNPTAPDEIETMITKTSVGPCPEREVPLLTPLGLVALIGVLSVVLIRKHRKSQ